MKVSLRAARINAGLSLREAAQRVRISESSLQRYEKGTATPRLSTVRALLALYGAQYDDIDFRMIDEEQVE